MKIGTKQTFGHNAWSNEQSYHSIYQIVMIKVFKNNNKYTQVMEK